MGPLRVALLACLAIPSGPALAWKVVPATEDVSLVAPPTMEDMTMRTQVGLRLPVLFGQLSYESVELHLWALSPEFHTQFAYGPIAVGASFVATNLWVTSPDIGAYFADAQSYGWRPGNPTLTFRFRRCLGNRRDACTGFAAAASFPADRIKRIYGISNPDSWTEEGDNVHSAAMRAHQDVTVSAVDHVVGRLIGFYAKDTGDITYQFDLGLLMHRPVLNEHFWRQNFKETTAVTALLGIAIGYRPIEGLVVLGEVRADLPITKGYILQRYQFGWFNLGLQGELGIWFPYLRIGFPLNEESRLAWSTFELQLEVGLTLQVWD